MITKELFESGYTYTAYREMIADKFAKGETTGPIQTPEKLEFTKINIQRMHRLDKTIQVDPQILTQFQHLNCKLNWLILAEAWCGDAAQNLPVLNKLAEAGPKIELRILLRDEHLELIDQFLTDGGRAIPKLILMNEQMEVIGTWGPRPKVAQDMVIENKRIGEIPYSEFAVVVQKWYLQDKGLTLQREMLQIVESSKCQVMNVHLVIFRQLTPKFIH